MIGNGSGERAILKPGAWTFLSKGTLHSAAVAPFAPALSRRSACKLRRRAIKLIGGWTEAEMIRFRIINRPGRRTLEQ
jgi:hypothetical protein